MTDGMNHNQPYPNGANEVLAHIESRYYQNSDFKFSPQLDYMIGDGVTISFLAKDRANKVFLVRFLNNYFELFSDSRALLKERLSRIAQLRHPNMIQIIEYYVESDSTYLITPFYEGKSLPDIIRPSREAPPKELPLETASYFIERIARIFDYAHSQGFIYDEISPSDIIINLNSANSELIIDCGFDGFLNMNNDESTIDFVKKYPIYRAPETPCYTPSTKSANIYILALIAFEMITGYPAFEGDVKYLNEYFHNDTIQIPKLSEKNPKLNYSPKLDKVFAKALAKDPNDRFPTSMEFYQQFNEAIKIVPLNPTILVGSGELIDNRYRLKKLVGRGTFGEVYLAEDTKFKPPRRVALKFLLQNYITNESLRDDLEREASKLSLLEHPNIVSVLDYDISESSAYIVTRFAEGGSLDDLLRPQPAKIPIRLPIVKVMFYIGKLADALDYAHSQRIIHLDIKPQNVLIDSRGEPMLADFGLATPIENSGFSFLINAFAGGTPSYMAPERWHYQAGRPSDIYAFAIMTYQLITGKLPFQGKGNEELYKEHVNKHVPPIYMIAPDLQYPQSLDHIFAKALAKDPQNRIRSAIGFYQEIRAAFHYR